MPSRRTVCRWIAKDPEFAREYAIAQKLRCEAMLDQTIDIIDDESIIFVEAKSDDGETVEKVEVKSALPVAIARANMRHGYIAKILPRTWGKDGLGLLVADPSAPALEPPRNGDTAKDMGNVIVLENHPLREQILLWQKAADEAKARR
jgi:Bacteriophage Sf6, terminase small subunit-like